MPLAPVKTTCCIAGGGPAGMMLGFLLARAGVRVAVLEKHADFLRDFRGDTIHPSTLELMHELGLLEDFLKLPHSKVTELSGQVGATRIHLADFRHLPTKCRFIALMPQWDFLDFLADNGKLYPGFDLRMRTEATDIIEEGGRIVGVRATTPDGPLEIRADLVVGCDGRRSTLRAGAGFTVDSIGAPIDVLWFRMSRRETDTEDTFGHMEAGRMMVMLNRGDYWQCAFVIPKGGIDRVKAQGLSAFRDSRDRHVGRRQAADGGGRPAAAVAPARAAVHRRCRPRDVTGRRRRRQPGDPRCRGGGEHSRWAAARWPRHRRSPRRRADAAHSADARDPVDPGAGAEPHPDAGAGLDCAAGAAMAGAAVQPVSAAAPAAGAADRHGHSARACADAGGVAGALC